MANIINNEGKFSRSDAEHREIFSILEGYNLEQSHNSSVESEDKYFTHKSESSVESRGGGYTPEKQVDGDYVAMKNVSFGDIIDSRDITMNKDFNRPTPVERLKNFRLGQASRIGKKLTPHKWRALVSKVRAEKTSSKVLHILEWTLLSKLAENRMRIFEIEKLKYGRKLKQLREAIEEEYKAIVKKTEENVNKKLERLRKNKRKVYEELFQHEVLSAAKSTEKELRNKYENYIMKLNDAGLKADYQFEMDSYCTFWKKKTVVISNQIQDQKIENSKCDQYFENQRLIECRSYHESKWRERAKEACKENIKVIEYLLTSIPPKERELVLLKDQNEQLTKKIGHWEKLMPNILMEMERFVEFSIKESPERESLLRSISYLNKFKDIEPEPVGRQERHLEREIPLDNIFTEEVPSDSTYAEFKQLLRIKENILDALNIVSSETSVASRSTKYSQIQKREVFDKSKLYEKMSGIIDITERIFQVLGDKFSQPDIKNEQKFLERRIISVDNILNQKP